MGGKTILHKFLKNIGTTFKVVLQLSSNDIHLIWVTTEEDFAALLGVIRSDYIELTLTAG